MCREQGGRNAFTFFSIFQITVEDYEQAAQSLLGALVIREKYSRLAYHNFPRTIARFLRNSENETWREEDEIRPGMADIYPNSSKRLPLSRFTLLMNPAADFKEHLCAMQERCFLISGSTRPIQELTSQCGRETQCPFNYSRLQNKMSIPA